MKSPPFLTAIERVTLWIVCAVTGGLVVTGSEAAQVQALEIAPSGLRLAVEERPGWSVLSGVLGFAVGACEEPADRPRLRDVLLAALGSPDGPGGRAGQRLEALGGSLSFEVGDEAVFIQAVLPGPDLHTLLDALAAGAGMDGSGVPDPDRGAVVAFVAPSLGPRGRVYWALRGAIHRGTPWAVSPVVALESAARTSSWELEEFRRRNFVGRRAFLAVVGAVTGPEVVEAASARFATLAAGSSPSPSRPIPNPRLGRTVVAVPSLTAWVALGYLGPPGGTAAAGRVEEWARRIGEGNTSLLCKALREEAGLTYWTGTTWEEGVVASLAIFWAECAPENVQLVEAKMRLVLSNQSPGRLQWRAGSSTDGGASRRLIGRQRALGRAQDLVQESIADNVRWRYAPGETADDRMGAASPILTLTPGSVGSPVVVIGFPEYERGE